MFARGVFMAIPQPTPAAPAEISSGIDTALGLIMYVSLAAVIALLVGMGLMLLGGETGRGGGLSKEMVSKFGAAIAALIVIAGATGIANFFS